MKKIVLLSIFLSNVAFAARLENVRVLDVAPGKGDFKLKLQTQDGPKDSYFFLDITKSDPDSFDKLVHIIKKMMSPDNYRLDLDIPSFSVSPSGSYYRSEGIHFYGPSEREPSNTGPSKKKR